MMNAPAEAKRLTCPACGRFLCSADGTYVDCAPCKWCGTQTTVDLKKTNPRALEARPGGQRREIDTPSGRIEVKRT